MLTQKELHAIERNRDEYIGWQCQNRRKSVEQAEQQLQGALSLLAACERNLKKLPQCFVNGIVARFRASDLKTGVPIPKGIYYYQQISTGAVLIHTEYETYGVVEDVWEAGKRDYRIDLY